MDAWISPEIAPWFSFFSLTSVGATLAVFVRRGEHRALVTAVWSAMALVGVVMLAGFLAGAAMGQPFPVLSLVYGWSVARLGKAYSASELRRTMAKDI